MELEIGESRVKVFPFFDFKGLKPGFLSASGNTPGGNAGSTLGYQEPGTLKFGPEGWWKVLGMSGSTTNIEEGGMPNLTNFNIQIHDAKTQEYWFNMDKNTDQEPSRPNLGAAVEAVAGKWGNPKFFRWPRLIAPGTELVLECVHYADVTPTGRSPFFLVLHCQFIGNSPLNNPILRRRGDPVFIPQRFDFSGAGAVDKSAAGFFINEATENTIQTQLGSPADVLIDSLQVRFPENVADPTVMINSWDPRQQEYEVLLKVMGSNMDNNFYQSNPALMCLVAGQFGARNFFLPSYFKLKKDAALVTTVINNTQTSFETVMDLTYSGLLAERK